MKTSLVLASLVLPLMSLSGTEFPGAAISSSRIKAKFYLPDPKLGFYRGTRFDWSGVIHSLQFESHNYYGPWFTKTNPAIHDFIYDGNDIVAGPCSAITGPVDEFKPLGWDDAKAGGTFIKIGVGALRKPATGEYDNYHLYDIADHGTWRVETKPDSIEFVQTLADSASGYAYVYTKTVQLNSGKPEMILKHTLKNSGKRAIETTVYNHNFLVLDGRASAAGLSIAVPFQIQSPKPPLPHLAEIRGNQIVYVKTLTGRDVVATPMQGFGPTPNDNQVRIESTAAGAGMSIHSDRPLLSESLWSIRSVVAVEPFISISIEPQHEFSWTSTYSYYTLPTSGK